MDGSLKGVSRADAYRFRPPLRRRGRSSAHPSSGGATWSARRIASSKGRLTFNGPPSTWESGGRVMPGLKLTAFFMMLCCPCKRRNILEQLPERQRPWVRAILTRAYASDDVKTARRRLQDLARRLDRDHPSAAASVREGREQTLTVIGLGLSERLQRSLV